nr:Chain S, Phage display-optimized HIV-1 protease substrate [Enterobacteria phage fd]
SGIFLETS